MSSCPILVVWWKALRSQVTQQRFRWILVRKGLLAWVVTSFDNLARFLVSPSVHLVCHLVGGPGATPPPRNGNSQKALGALALLQDFASNSKQVPASLYAQSTKTLKVPAFQYMQSTRMLENTGCHTISCTKALAIPALLNMQASRPGDGLA